MCESADTRPILLFSPLIDVGHLTSWLVIFTDSFVRLGYQVYLLAPQSSNLRRELDRKGYSQSDKRVMVLDYCAPLKEISLLGFTTWLGRTRLIKALSTKTKQLMRDLHVSRFIRLSSINVRSDRQEVEKLDPIWFAIRTRAALGSLGVKPKLVINMYLDIYKHDKKDWQAFERNVNFPWVALQFHPRGHWDPSISELRSLRGLLVLDSEYGRELAAKHKGKSTLTIPDVTDSFVAADLNSTAKLIRSLAGGRTVVFMGGLISSKKNIQTWLNLINLADPQKVFFLQVGHIFWGDLSSEETLGLSGILREGRENVYILNKYIDAEPDFNAFISVADIIFAAYLNFSGSSNIINKAASLKKPILVARGHLMAKKVTDYQVGWVVDELDAASIYRKILNYHPGSSAFNYDRYIREHSVDVLLTKLNQLVALCN